MDLYGYRRLAQTTGPGVTSPTTRLRSAATFKKLSYHIISYYIIIIPHHIILHHVMSDSSISHHIMPCHTKSYHTSHHKISYHIVFRACGTGRPGHLFFDIRGRYNRGKHCTCMWIWECIFKGASKTPSKEKQSPNCADDAPVRGERAPRTGASSAQLGLFFSFGGVFNASLKIAPI